MFWWSFEFPNSQNHKHLPWEDCPEMVVMIGVGSSIAYFGDAEMIQLCSKETACTAVGFPVLSSRINNAANGNIQSCLVIWVDV